MKFNKNGFVITIFALIIFVFLTYNKGAEHGFAYGFDLGIKHTVEYFVKKQMDTNTYLRHHFNEYYNVISIDNGKNWYFQNKETGLIENRIYKPTPKQKEEFKKGFESFFKKNNNGLPI